MPLNEADHLPMSQWVDWARGLASSEEAEAVERHLSEGCGACTRMAEALLRVVNSAASERLADPPGEAVSAAEELFSQAELKGRAEGC